MALQLVPHFDLPFRFSGSSVAVVEQDSAEDVANCVEAIVRTPNGTRDDSPEFGLDDQTFLNQNLDSAAILAQIEYQEPRSRLVVESEPDFLDNLIARVSIKAGG